MRYLLFPTAVAVLSACSPALESPASVQVSDAVCRPAGPGRDVTGCYVTLTANRADRLIAVSSAFARDVQIHEMKTENGVMQMGELTEGVALPAGETVRLAPGGNHLMVFGSTRPLEEGAGLALTLTFEQAPAQTVPFRVGQPGVPG
jgi:protein SCO1/2